MTWNKLYGDRFPFIGIYEVQPVEHFKPVSKMNYLKIILNLNVLILFFHFPSYITGTDKLIQSEQYKFSNLNLFKRLFPHFRYPCRYSQTEPTLNWASDSAIQSASLSFDDKFTKCICKTIRYPSSAIKLCQRSFTRCTLFCPKANYFIITFLKRLYWKRAIGQRIKDNFSRMGLVDLVFS